MQSEIFVPEVSHDAGGAQLVIMIILHPRAVAGGVPGDAPAVAKDVIGVCAGRGVQIRDHIAAEIKVLSAGAQ